MRSFLFVPGDNPAMLQNAFVFESDAVIIDLEDAVSINNKDSARVLVNEYLKKCANLNQVVVRVNGMDTPFFEEDMKMLNNFSIFAVMVPKINIEVMEAFISKYSQKVIPIIESALAVTQIADLIKYDEALGYLLGAEDLANDMEFNRTNLGNEIFLPRTNLVYHAKAYNKLAIDTPTTDANSTDRMIEDCNIAKSLGFKSKACIHPNQVPIVNSTFMASEEEILWAKRVLQALENATNKGAFSLDGKMIDEPIIKKARTIIASLKKSGV